MASSSQTPFAQLSFSEQQEQWRIFRARQLEFREAPSPAEQAPAVPPRAPVSLRGDAPRHGSLDRVRAQLAAASRRAGAFQPVAPDR